jgi:hypothetical protein
MKSILGHCNYPSLPIFACKFAGWQLVALVRDADIDLSGAESDFLLAQ